MVGFNKDGSSGDGVLFWQNDVLQNMSMRDEMRYHTINKKQILEIAQDYARLQGIPV